MSAVVGGWMDELAKLKKRVQARRPFLSRAQKEHQLVKEGHVEKNKAAKETTTMSEATVCLLMDRFVPW
ncbi:hypothetical protein PTKIN_Ptkin10aG0185400 [Pterospermum kingtungense]